MWEYKILKFYYNEQRDQNKANIELNQLGKDGWEMITCSLESGNNFLFCAFKRFYTELK